MTSVHLALASDDDERHWPQVAVLDRPAFVPRTTGRRQEMTGPAGASNPQVSNEIRPSPQVVRSAPRTLSRWRHGFKSRWDYAGQRPCPEPPGFDGESEPWKGRIHDPE